MSGELTYEPRQEVIRAGGPDPVRQPKCPFYGFHNEPHMCVLIEQHGNECGLQSHAYTPCLMERAGLLPSLERCEILMPVWVVANIRAHYKVAVLDELLPFAEWEKRC